MTEECNLRPSVSENTCVFVCVVDPLHQVTLSSRETTLHHPPSATSPYIAVNQPLIGMQAGWGNTGTSPRSRSHNGGLHPYRNTSRGDMVSQCAVICRCRANNNENNNEQHCNNSLESFCGRPLLCQQWIIMVYLFIICHLGMIIQQYINMNSTVFSR